MCLCKSTITLKNKKSTQGSVKLFIKYFWQVRNETWQSKIFFGWSPCPVTIRKYFEPWTSYNFVIYNIQTSTILSQTKVRHWNFLKHLSVLHDIYKWSIISVVSDFRNVILKLIPPSNKCCPWIITTLINYLLINTVIVHPNLDLVLLCVLTYTRAECRNDLFGSRVKV